ncbi:hypothetical protein E2C01_049896 [Portunus trituberculatus]|uniref:Uncharacterized protein n=1 Tax=Portunus trituberculatus TaxID=210409 RepID=A0A5B7GFK2_PORTR|nr:hypothetical protein [Portunus trituberculatus]
MRIFARELEGPRSRARHCCRVVRRRLHPLPGPRVLPHPPLVRHTHRDGIKSTIPPQHLSPSTTFATHATLKAHFSSPADSSPPTRRS